MAELPQHFRQRGRRVRLKPDRRLLGNVRRSNDFLGEVINRQHIGRSSDCLVALWNAEHPENPVE